MSHIIKRQSSFALIKDMVGAAALVAMLYTGLMIPAFF